MAVKRIVAIVLPQLACELVKQRGPVSPSGKAPLAVILGGDEERRAAAAPRPEREPQAPAAVIDVVDDEARRYGVRPGQKVVEAAALVAHLAIHRVTFAEIDAALGRVAEVALGLGATAAIQLGEQGAPRAGASRASRAPERAASEARSPWGDGPYDTVWLDITGASHLVGGEEALLGELGERVAALGHRARLAIADGPRLAQALARFGAHADGGGGAEAPIAPPGKGAQAIGPLPVQALPVEREVASFLVRLGVLRVEDLARLPRAQVAARLGPRTADVMELLAGRDPVPLLPFEVPRLLEEEVLFDEPIESAESLLFVLRGMTSRIASRLAARGEACGRLNVAIAYDRSIARLRLGEREDDGAAAALLEDDGRGPSLRFHVDMPVPLSDAGDLLRPLKAKLERIELAAPAVGVHVIASRIARARRVQLDLSRDRSVDPDSLPALLAELSAEIGQERVGILEIADAHRPEARSRLVPASGEAAMTRASAAARARAAADRGAAEQAEGADAPALEPARLLAQPIPLGRVGRGAIVAVDRHLYAIERLSFVMRIDAVEWWTPTPASRDYARAWLVSGSPSGKAAPARLGELRPPRDGASASSCGEAWIYVDRATGEAFLQGWCE
ncbi:Y-family DNA polymerase [Sorangium atrum]|uniref:DNA polymerase Y family protein n=1 Tax=Sorangium atrum TaxID=2995308 RepID=A0ABT5CA32_9BACT|nr:DNA polymerase Y family protein [Sorangium aterium]MDC0683278.1 DNA polymerase Y family protein [Sorangium aterium]